MQWLPLYTDCLYPQKVVVRQAGDAAANIPPFSDSSLCSLLQHAQTVVVRQAGDAAADEDDEQKKDWKFGRNEGGMSWGWKLCAAILYMLPWVDVTEKTVYFIERFPVFAWTEYFTGALGAKLQQALLRTGSFRLFHLAGVVCCHPAHAALGGRYGEDSLLH
jgi:hypothetical protein